MKCLKSYQFFWLFFLFAEVDSQAYDSTFTELLQLKPLDRVIFIFSEDINLHLENKDNRAVLGTSFEPNRIGTNTFDLTKNDWCESIFRYLEDGSWQKGNNIVSIWYDDETFGFKMNNYSGTHKSNCTDIPSTASIDHLRIFYNFNNKKNVRHAIVCTKTEVSNKRMA